MNLENTKPRSWFRSVTLFAAFLAFGVGLYIFFNSFTQTNLKIPEENLASSSVPLPHTSGVPVRIRIPSIQVEAPVERVGLTQEGLMDAPKTPGDTGWFDLGPRPGERGSAVIAGHRGWRTGPAVFDNLHKIRVGDEVRVTDEEGKELVFVVRDTRIYDADEKVPEVWNKDDTAHLNIITCSGKWNSRTRTSDERLVVFTDLVI